MPYTDMNTGTVYVQIIDNNTGNCLGLDSSNGDIGEASPGACNSVAQYTLWKPHYDGHDSNLGYDIWTFASDYPGYTSDCIYDYKQAPAIYAGCSFSSTYEQFAWGGLTN